MHNKLKYCLIGLTLTLLLGPAAAVLAQNSTGEIDGTVTDSSGAVIPGAMIKLFNSNTGQLVRTVKTNEKGDYSLPQLDVGSYQINVSFPGFQTKDITGIDLHIADTLTQNATLSTGDTATTVTVTADSNAPNTETSEQSSVINNQEMNELALATRNFEEMALIQPGVSYDPGAGNGMPGTVDSTGRSSNSHGLSINGMRQQQISWTLDGSDILNHGDNQQVTIFPSVTSIREMKVFRNSYGAQYGGGGSAQVMISSQSGGARIRGNIFFFNRPPALAAVPYSNVYQALKVGTPSMKYNDFGWAFGGPVFIPRIYPRSRSKTFFFYENELRRNTLYPTQNINDYPEEPMLYGWFRSPVCAWWRFTPGAPKQVSQCPAATNRAQQDNSSPYMNYHGTGIDYNYNIYSTLAKLGIVPSPVAQEYVRDMMLPAVAMSPVNTPIVTDDVDYGVHSSYQVVQQVASPYTETQTLVRIDHQFGERFNGFIRYIYDPIKQTVSCGIYSGNNTCMPGVAKSHTSQYGESFALHGTWVITPTMVADFGGSFNPYQVKSVPFGTAMAANSPDIHVQLPPGFVNTTGRVPGVVISTANWDTVGPFLNHNNTLQIFENTTKQLRQHSLYFGVNYERYTGYITDGTLNAGQFTSNQGGSVGQQVTNFEQNFASFLAGQPSQFVIRSLDPIARPSMDLWEAYIQDNWRILPRLTVNGGLRYSIYGQVTDRGGHLGGFQPEAYNPAMAPTVDPQYGDRICTSTSDPGCNGTGQAVNLNYDPLNGITRSGVNSPYGKAMSSTPLNGFAP
ncbi:MAG: TonB-dependent receptor, partial [Acidobacteriaceae bacterium]|nr:TonB-dependent receptor [Acidobacteriaceae bacterium]